MPIKVVAITGSLRKASVNAGLLRAAAKIAPQHDMEITIVSADLPLFNEDLEEAGPAGLPETVKNLRAQLASSDAVFFGVEEFNSSVSGVLKNAIDWASRSYEGADSPLKGKPSASVGAGGHFGAARGRAALLPIVKEVGCIHMPGPELQIKRWGSGPASFDANGNLESAEHVESLEKVVVAFSIFCREHLASKA